MRIAHADGVGALSRIVRLLPFTEVIKVVVAITYSFVFSIELVNEVSFFDFLGI